MSDEMPTEPPLARIRIILTDCLVAPSLEVWLHSELPLARGARLGLLAANSYRVVRIL